VERERLQKFLAARGVASRRQVEAWIEAGRLTVDGRRATPGQRVAGHESFQLDGRPLRIARNAPSRPRILAYHKPAGEITTRRDPAGRPTVFARLPRIRGARWISVGRLDLQTSGLLLFTTDGALASRLMHPSAGITREYAVRVAGGLDESQVEALRNGAELDDGPARFEHIDFAGGEGLNRWYRVVVTEGRNRLVRRLIEAVGGQVSRLTRVRFGPATLGRRLPRGHWRELAPGGQAALYHAAGLATPPASRPAGHARRPRRRR